MAPSRTGSDPAPQPPEMPDAAECCGEGCVRCVFDIYDAARERYECSLGEWRARNPDNNEALER